MEPWYDTHVHLDRYNAAERERLLARAAEASVEIIGVAVDIESSRALLQLGGPGVAGTVVGIHPTRAGMLNPELARLASTPGVLGIGECGFDASGPDWRAQVEAFRGQCHLARHLGLAVVLHIDGEGAWDQLVAHSAELKGLRVVRHYFTGDESQAAWHFERGHFVSFGNPLRRDKKLRDVVFGAPPELLLIETDSYPLPGRRTEPADVAKIGETVALLRNWTFAEARAQLAANTRDAFGNGPEDFAKLLGRPL